MTLEPAQRLRILVTGASSGIGRAASLRLAQDGHALAVVARRSAPLRDLAEEVGALAFAADLASSSEAERAVGEASERLGGLDALVYSAGGALFRPLGQTTDAVWQEILGANLHGLFYTARAAVPHLRASGRGRLVAVLSIASRRGFPNATAYTAAKAGALGFLDSLREELRADPVQVTALLAGATDTPLWDAIEGEWDRARMMRPAQVAEVIAACLGAATAGTWEEVRIGPPAGAL